MIATTAPRFVAAPWERGGVSTTGISVGVEDYVEPESGPREEYRNYWPHRDIAWNREHQRFEVVQVNPATGHFERYEMIFGYDVAPDPKLNRAWTSEEIADMIESHDPRLVKCFRHFDYLFVRERMRQSFEFRHTALKRQQDRRTELNRRLQDRRLLGVHEEMEYFLKHELRWLSTIENLQKKGVTYLHEREPMVAGGLN